MKNKEMTERSAKKTAHFHRAIALALALTCVLSLSSCLGQSAYELAVEQGYEGTESEWVEGLNGKDGSSWLHGTQAPAAEDGKEGDMYLNTATCDVWQKKDGAWMLLCNIKGAPGVPAKQIKSTYEAYCEQYGYEGSEREWLAKVHEKLSETTPTDIYQIAKRATVGIECYDNEGDRISSGSGFFIDKDGLLVTAYHVIKGAHEVKVRLSETEIYAVDSVVGFDIERDLVLLKLDVASKKFASLELETRGVTPGDTIYSFGSPLGLLDGTFSSGIVSAALRTEELDEKGKETVQYVQFTASISSGNSGGPLLNSRGKVVGIVDAHYSSGNDLNLAVYVNELDKVERNYNHDIEKFYKDTEYYLTKFGERPVYETEQNGTAKTANRIQSGDSMCGYVNDEDVDCFTFTVSGKSPYHVTLAYYMFTYSLTGGSASLFYYPQLINEKGELVELDWEYYDSDPNETMVYTDAVLEPGTYTVVLLGYYPEYTVYSLYLYTSPEIKYELFPYPIEETDFIVD